MISALAVSRLSARFILFGIPLGIIKTPFLGTSKSYLYQEKGVGSSRLGFYFYLLSAKLENDCWGLSTGPAE